MMIYFNWHNLAPVLGWGRYEHFEYGCCIAFSDPSLNSRSFVITALIAVFFLPICKGSLQKKCNIPPSTQIERLMFFFNTKPTVKM